MKKLLKSFLFLSVLISSTVFSQVGINTSNPQATLDVASSPNDNKAVDGLIAPRLTGNQLRSKNSLYLAAQKGAIVYVTAADSAPAGKTIDVTKEGYYYFDGSKWVNFTASSSSSSSYPIVGDVKYGFQTSDHDGWFLLDGRSITSLPSSTNQSNARSIFSTNYLPNAKERVLKMKGRLESTGGQISASVLLGQINLPRITLYGRTDEAGAHTHRIINNSSDNYLIAGGRSHTVAVANSGYYGFPEARYLSQILGSLSASSAGNHSHQVTMALNNFTQQSPININTENNYLGVNVFVFLGVN